jgi:hypothetical protein
MVFIDNPFDMTLTPPGSRLRGTLATYSASSNNVSGLTFDQARQANSIYEGNGLICQVKMCNSMTGCENPNGCPNNPDWNKIVDFCGINSTRTIAMDGSIWYLQPKDLKAQLLSATEKATGFNPLPNPYNVVGMY